MNFELIMSWNLFYQIFVISYFIKSIYIKGTIFAYGQTGSGKTFTMTGGTERLIEKNKKNNYF